MRPRYSATDPLLHPWTWGSMLVLAFNDHFLKYAYPSWVTGKLSDFAGLIFVPILLDVIVCHRKWAVLLIGTLFASVKLTQQGNDLCTMLYQIIFDMMGWGEAVPLVMDETDCIALVILWIPMYCIPVSEGENEEDS